MRRESREASGVATAIVLSMARQGAVSTDELIHAVGVYSGVKITVREDQLDDGQVGFTERNGDQVVIIVSDSCATRQHTLAHELGHVALGHKHCGVRDMLCPPPESCEELWRLLTSQLDEQEAADERQAEVFAEKVIDLLPLEPSAVSHEAVWKAALLG